MSRTPCKRLQQKVNPLCLLATFFGMRSGLFSYCGNWARARARRGTAAHLPSGSAHLKFKVRFKTAWTFYRLAQWRDHEPPLQASHPNSEHAASAGAPQSQNNGAAVTARMYAAMWVVSANAAARVHRDAPESQTKEV